LRKQRGLTPFPRHDLTGSYQVVWILSIGLSVAAFLAYLRPELLTDWGNRVLLCY